MSTPAEKQKGIELFSISYFLACMIGGVLDLVKCRRQTLISDGNIPYTQAIRLVYEEGGFQGVYLGWLSTFIGYGLLGAGKFGFYEVFKYLYGDVLFPGIEKALLFLSASATAEFLADIALCPWEAIKVRVQTSTTTIRAPGQASFHNPRSDWSRTHDAWVSITGIEGPSALFKGLYALWGRQIPYTMVKFFTFESIVAYIYKSLLGDHPRSSYAGLTQTVVSFLGGYLAGVLCAVVSNPADVMVSKVNAEKQTGEHPIATMRRIYRELGFSGLWKGLSMRILMIGTLTALQWFVYDSWKVFMNIPTTGGAIHDKVHH